VARAGDQDGVDGVEGGVLLLHDVVGREEQVGVAQGRGEGRCAGAEERGEDAAVAAVLGDGAGEGGVALEDCDAEGEGGHCGVGGGVGGGRWSGLGFRVL